MEQGGKIKRCREGAGFISKSGVRVVTEKESEIGQLEYTNVMEHALTFHPEEVCQTDELNPFRSYEEPEAYQDYSGVWRTA